MILTIEPMYSNYTIYDNIQTVEDFKNILELSIRQQHKGGFDVVVFNKIERFIYITPGFDISLAEETARKYFDYLFNNKGLPS